MDDHKKDGGLIKNWQAQESEPPGSSVLIGTLVEDTAGRFQPGETPGNTAWPHDYQDFARNADPGEGFL